MGVGGARMLSYSYVFSGVSDLPPPPSSPIPSLCVPTPRFAIFIFFQGFLEDFLGLEAQEPTAPLIPNPWEALASA